MLPGNRSGVQQAVAVGQTGPMRPAAASKISDQRGEAGVAARVVAAVVIGLAIGTATSFAQAHLDGPWAALANSASPWLLGGFVAGAVQIRLAGAVAAGLGACVLEVVAYYVVTAARGYPINHAEIVFWAVCAVVGGPIFGYGGWVWLREPSRFRPMGASLLPATFIAEAIGTYTLRLQYHTTMLLYLVIGVVLFGLVAWPVRRLLPMVTYTAAATAIGIIIYWLALDSVAGMHFMA